MAWSVDNNNNLTMAEEDFGVGLKFEFQLEATLTARDTIQFVIKRNKNADPIITKDYNVFENNTVSFVLTEEDSEKLPIGTYVYRVDWFQEGSFMDNLILCSTLRVVDKA